MTKENIDLLDLYSVDTGDNEVRKINLDQDNEENQVEGNVENVEKNKEEVGNEKTGVENEETTTENEEIDVDDLLNVLENEESTEEENEEGVEEENEETEEVKKEGNIEDVKEELQDVIDDLKNEISDEYIRKLVELEQQLTEYQIKNEMREQKMQELLKENQRLKDELMYYKNTFGEGEENPEYEIAKILILAKENPKYKRVAIEKLKTTLENLTGEPVNLNVSELFSEEGGGGGEEKMTKKVENNQGINEDLINEYGIDVSDVEW